MGSTKRMLHSMKMWGFIFGVVVFVISLIALVLTGVIMEELRDRSFTADTDGECDDLNTCTTDYNYLGGCANVRKKVGAACSNVCYSSGDSDVCNEFGRCVGSNETCVGQTCSNATVDCPDLGDSLTASCSLGMCIYTATIASAFPAQPVVADGARYVSMCQALEDVENEYVLGSCLDISPSVSTGSTTLRCVWTFKCAVPSSTTI